MAPLLETSQPVLGEMPHDARYAPDDSLAEPTRENMIPDARGEDKVSLGGDDTPREGKILLPRAYQRPHHGERGSRSRGTPQTDVFAIIHEITGFFERHHLVSKAAIPRLGLFPER